MAERGYLSNLLKTLAVGSSGLATGAAGAIPGTLSYLTSGTTREQPGPFDDDLNLKKLLDPSYSIGSKFIERSSKGLENVSQEALQGYSEKYTGGYTKPEGKIQEAVKDIGQDVGSFLGMGGKIKPALRIAAVGNSAYQGAKSLGASEAVANYAKIGATASSWLFKKSGIKSLSKKLYDNASSSITPETSVPAIDLIQSAKESIKKASKGGIVPHASAVKRFSKSLIAKSKNGRIAVEELWEFKKQLNDQITRGVFAKNKRFLLEPLEKQIRSSLSEYGNINKEFGSSLKNADVLFGIEKGLPVMDKIINKTIGLKDSGLAEYFRKSLYYGAGGIKGLMTKAALGALSKSGEALLRSPAYRKEAVKLAASSIKGNFPATTKSLKKLAKIHEKFTSELTNKSGTKFKIVNDYKEYSEQSIREFDTATGLNNGFKIVKS